MKFDPMKPAPPVTRIAFPIMLVVSLAAAEIPESHRPKTVVSARAVESLIVIEKAESPNYSSRLSCTATWPRNLSRPPRGSRDRYRSDSSFCVATVLRRSNRRAGRNRAGDGCRGRPTHHLHVGFLDLLCNLRPQVLLPNPLFGSMTGRLPNLRIRQQQ